MSGGGGVDPSPPRKGDCLWKPPLSSEAAIARAAATAYGFDGSPDKSPAWLIGRIMDEDGFAFGW